MDVEDENESQDLNVDELDDSGADVETEDSDEEIDYESMTVAQLKAVLKEAGKPVSGKKADLISRIME